MSTQNDHILYCGGPKVRDSRKYIGILQKKLKLTILLKYKKKNKKIML